MVTKRKEHVDLTIARGPTLQQKPHSVSQGQYHLCNWEALEVWSFQREAARRANNESLCFCPACFLLALLETDLVGVSQAEKDIDHSMI